MATKQLGFTAAFLLGGWFFIKWNDRWFRQHADAEFMLKQYELDVRRASWVVEMALEWAEEQETELPPGLLDHLARNLFVHPHQAHDEDETPTDLPSLLFGAASRMNLKTPLVDLEVDRKGLKGLKPKSE